MGVGVHNAQCFVLWHAGHGCFRTAVEGMGQAPVKTITQTAWHPIQCTAGAIRKQELGAEVLEDCKFTTMVQYPIQIQLPEMDTVGTIGRAS